MSQIVLDTETTGLNKDKDKIIEIGCILIGNDLKEISSKQWYVNPGIKIPYEAYKVHGINNEMVEDKPFFANVYHEFLKYVGKLDIIAHNANFDIGFIQAELKRNGYHDFLEGRNVIDTLKIARKKIKKGKKNLDSLCKRFGVPNTRGKHHGALKDARLLAQVYWHLMDKGQLSFVDELSLCEDVECVVDVDPPKRFYPDRGWKLTKEEEKKHAEFMRDIAKHCSGKIRMYETVS